jgi:hypothetical protein
MMLPVGALNAFHMIFVAGMLFIVACMLKHSIPTGECVFHDVFSNDGMAIFLAIVAGAIFLFHGYMLLKKRRWI